MRFLILIIFLISTSLSFASNFSEVKGSVNWSGNVLSQTGTMGTSSNFGFVIKTNNTPRLSISNVGLVDVSGTLNAAVLCIANTCQTSWPSGGGGAALSGLTAATAGTTLANANFSQIWNWDTLTTTDALTIGSTSLTTGSLLNVANTNASATTGTAIKASTAGTGAGYAIHANNTGTNNTGYAVYGINNPASNTGASYGGYFETTSTGLGVGVKGVASGGGAASSIGVYGTNNGTGIAYSVYGSNTGVGNIGAAVAALNSSTGTAYAAYGRMTGAGNTGYSIYGTNTSSTGYGVYSNGRFAVVPTAPTFVSTATTDYNSGIFTAPTINLIAGVAVTSQMNSFIFSPPTLSTGVAVSDASTLTVAGAPIKAGTGSINNTYGIKVNAGAVSTATNSFGLFVDAPTGATNNYAAVFNSGNVGVGITAPSARLHLTYGTTSASGAPLKLTAGTNLTTPEAGAIEYDGSKLYYTTSTPTRKQLAVYAPTKFWVPAAMCSIRAATAIFDLPNGSNPTPTCYGTSPQSFGALDYADTSILSAQFSVELPSDWDSSGGVDIKLVWFVNSASANSVMWTVATSCVANNEDLLAPAFNAAQNIVSAGLGTANRKIEATLTGITITGCAAGETMFIRIGRTGNDAADTMAATASLLGVEVTAHRAP